jgi:hypothetical protein
MPVTLRRLALALGLIATFSAAAAAQGVPEGSGDMTKEEIEILKPIDELGDKALKELEAKSYEPALAHYKEAAAALEGAKVRDELKKPRSQLIHYNTACGLSLTGKKDEAVKEFARSVDDGYWLWSDIEKDKDLDPIRNEDGYKKAVESGKAAEKTAIEAHEKLLPGAVKKSIEGKPLFPVDIDSTDLDEKPITLDAFHGKALIVHYFAMTDDSGFPEIPLLVKLYEKYHDKGLEIVGVGLGEREALAEYVKKKGMKWQVAAVGPRDRLVDLAVKRRAQILFLDRGGQVRARAGAFSSYDPLEEAVKLLLDTKTPRREPKKDD